MNILHDTPENELPADSRAAAPPALFLLASLVVALAACVGSGPRGSGWNPGGEGEHRATLQVENYHWADVRVSAITAGSRYRLGMVASQSSETFTLPPSIGADRDDLVFEAVPMASSEAHRSELIRINPGERLVWRLENQLGLSAFFVR
jgi:hypothetical protein